MNHALQKKLKEVDLLQNEIQQKRPVTGKNLDKIKDYWRIGLTYTSNALEGNSLTESETKVILEDGITIGGKSLRDTLECIGHSNAVKFIYDLNDMADEALMLELHRLFFTGIDSQNAGAYRKENVIITGTDYKPPTFEDVPSLVKKEFAKIKEPHPVIAAAERHLVVANVHPFVDGNGRTARLLMNFHLLKNGFPVVAISPVVRAPYIAACAQGNKGHHEPFFEFMISQVIESQRDYMRLLS
jgi:Fic family protein